MSEEFELTGDRNTATPPSRKRIKHLLIGSPKVVRRTIQTLHGYCSMGDVFERETFGFTFKNIPQLPTPTLHVQGYAEANGWSKLVAANALGEPGEVVSILMRYVAMD